MSKVTKVTAEILPVEGSAGEIEVKKPVAVGIQAPLATAEILPFGDAFDGDSFIEDEGDILVEYLRPDSRNGLMFFTGSSESPNKQYPATTKVVLFSYHKALVEWVDRQNTEALVKRVAEHRYRTEAEKAGILKENYPDAGFNTFSQGRLCVNTTQQKANQLVDTYYLTLGILDDELGVVDTIVLPMKSTGIKNAKGLLTLVRNCPVKLVNEAGSGIGAFYTVYEMTLKKHSKAGVSDWYLPTFSYAKTEEGRVMTLKDYVGRDEDKLKMIINMYTGIKKGLIKIADPEQESTADEQSYQQANNII